MFTDTLGLCREGTATMQDRYATLINYVIRGRVWQERRQTAQQSTNNSRAGSKERPLGWVL